MPPDQLNEITSQFGPGISILYGTFVSLTLSILYGRQKNIQGAVTLETSLLSLLTRNLLAIFKKDKERTIEGGQCVADQIRILVKESRGKELMTLIYSDPYARILELIEEVEDDLIEANKEPGAQGARISHTRDIIKDMMRCRAQRLSDEALVLPPTHYFILTILTLLILLGYTISTLPTIASDGSPPIESSILFSILCTTYVLFYSFTADLNNPFRGVYQIRRSSTAAHLLQTKWLIVNHPILKGNVDFNACEAGGGDMQGNGGTKIWTPGLGEMLLKNERSDD